MDQPKWEMMKQLCFNQNAEFRQWQQQKRFGQFHWSHYDWWAFPIDRKSSHGDKYKLSSHDRAMLQVDREFIDALRSNAILVCKAWGYDLQKGEEIKECESDQCWQDWPIRLYKLVNSLEYFDQGDLFLNAIEYGLKLIKEGKDFTYGPKNLKPVFYKNEVFLQNRKKRQRQAAKLAVNEAKEQQIKQEQKQVECQLQKIKLGTLEAEVSLNLQQKKSSQ